MRVVVLLFAQARERAGTAETHLDLPAGSRVADALESLVRTHPGLAELRAHLAVAVDGTLARAADALPGDCELALLPPVSGG